MVALEQGSEFLKLYALHLMDCHNENINGLTPIGQSAKPRI
jgi:hypothetical protein